MQAANPHIAAPKFPLLVLCASCAAVLLALLSPSARAAQCGNEAIRAEQGPAALALPDCRAYELVSPGGSPFVNTSNTTQGARASLTGDGLAYWTRYPASDAERSTERYLATRGSAGWSVEAVAPQESPPSSKEGNCANGLEFSPDLSKSVLTAGWDPGPESKGGSCGEIEEVLVPGAPSGYSNLYLQEESGGPYALVNVTPEGVQPANAVLQDYTPDFSRLLFASAAQLTPEAPPGDNLYLWSEGALHLIPFLPDGEPVSGTVANGGRLPSGAGGFAMGLGSVTGAMSSDGEEVFFYANGNLYLRRNATQPPTAGGACTPIEPDNACTVQVDLKKGGSGASGGGVFWFASENASRVFFTAESKLTAGAQASVGKPDLYEYEVATGVLRDRTKTEGFPEPNARGFSGASANGDHLYFVARGVLIGSGTNGQGAAAQPSGYNLYLLRDGVVTFVVTLDGSPAQDQAIWQEAENGPGTNTGNLSTAVSPSGRYFAFATALPLTGFDNTPAGPGACEAACTELFLFDAQTEQLACVSCDPGGARPLGHTRVNGPTEFTNKGVGKIAYFAREVFDDGRVFFTTPNGLVSGDVNGSGDVYQYLDGELKLISSGTAVGASVFLDASSSGSNVFFATPAGLVGSDTDNAMSAYVARVGGGFAEPPFPPPPCEGESCRGPGSAPGNVITPGSLNFSGAQEGPRHPRGVRCKRGFVKRQGKCRKKTRHTASKKHRGAKEKKQQQKRRNARNSSERNAR